MITEIKVNFGYTASMGKNTYEFARFDMGATKTVNIESEEELISEENKLMDLLEHEVMKRVNEITNV